MVVEGLQALLQVVVPVAPEARFRLALALELQSVDLVERRRSLPTVALVVATATTAQAALVAPAALSASLRLQAQLA
jgi:hypothetical protein